MKRNRLFRMRLAWLGLFCGVATAIHAQQPADTLTHKVHEMPNVTVQARRASKALLATAPTHQLKREAMLRMGTLEVADAVKHFAGATIKDYGGIGGLKTVSVRSLGAQHTAVLYDGVAVSDAQSGQVDISRFSLENVSALTLQIGQADHIFQTAKAFASAGVLSIETLSPQFGENPYQLSATLKGGSFGYLNPSLYYAQKLNKRFVVSGSVDYMRADGNYPFEMWNGNKLIDEKRNNSDIESYRAELNLFAQLTDKQELRVKAYLFDSDRGLPGGVIYDNPYAAERLYDRNYFGQFNYLNQWHSQWKWQVNGKFNYSWNRNYNNQSSGITDDRFQQRESYLSTTLWHEPLKGLSLSIAQDISYNNLATTLQSNQSPERITSLTALAAHYRNRWVTATASLLHTYITERVESGDAAPNRKRLSPSVSLSLKPFEAPLRIRASYQDIYRTPTFNDLYYAQIGNRSLRPETTRQWNVGATWNTPIWGPIATLNLTVDGYYNRVKDKIVAVPTMFVWKMSNLGEVETWGADVSLTSEVILTDGYHLHLTGSYSLMIAEDVTNPDSKVWRNQIIYTPKHSGSGSIGIETPFATLSANLFYASERYTMGQNLPENRIPHYTDWGLSLSRSFKWGKHRLRLQLDALNLGGTNYEIIRYYPMPGRNYKATLNYQL
ncbi:MAG: TonB-dependent receptor plug domain-containing protein [Phocaeicola sp.]